MNSLWSEAVARKTKSAAHDFPKVHADKILHIYSQECGDIKIFQDRQVPLRHLSHRQGSRILQGCEAS